MTVRARQTSDRPAGTGVVDAPVDVASLIDSWARSGLVTADQAEAMRRDAIAAHQPGELRPRAEIFSLVVEGLGYLGSVIVVAALLVLGVTYWTDLSSAVRVGLAGLAAVGLSTAALVVGGRTPAAIRMRSVSLASATVAFGGLVAIVAREYGGMHGLDDASLAAFAASAYALLVWWRYPGVLQQVTTLGALLLTAGCLTAELPGPDGLPGLAVWAVGVVWALLAWGGLLRPRELAEALGAAAAVFGAMLTMPTDAGNVLGIGTAVLVVAGALVVRSLLLLAVGALGALQSTMVTVAEWFPGRVAAPVALLAVGGALVVAAVLLARRRASRGTGARSTSRLAQGSARAAILAAGAVDLMATCTIAGIVAA